MTNSILHIVGRPAVHYCERKWKWQPQPFKDFDVWIVFSGRGQLTANGTQYEVSAGSSLIFQPGDIIRCSHDPDNPLVVFSCHFHCGETGKEMRYRKDLIRTNVVESDLLQSCAKLAAKVFDDGSTGREFSTALVAQMVAQINYLFGHDPSPKPNQFKLADLTLDIRSRPGDSWSVAKMAAKCGFSEPHFNRVFRKAYDCSPTQYVIRHRILRAIALLRDSDMTLQQIADSLGYQDIFFFHRQFRRVAKTTPRSIRLGVKCVLDTK